MRSQRSSGGAGGTSKVHSPPKATYYRQQISRLRLTRTRMLSETSRDRTRNFCFGRPANGDESLFLNLSEPASLRDSASQRRCVLRCSSGSAKGPMQTSVRPGQIPYILNGKESGWLQTTNLTG